MKASDRRRSILEAACRAFSKFGYLGTTTRGLAREAGISEVTLYRHFSGKEEIFRVVAEEQSILAEISSLPSPRGEGDLRAVLTSVGTFALETLARRKSIIRIMLSDAWRHPRVGHMVYRELVEKLIDRVARLLASCRDRGQLRPLPPGLMARAFLGMFFYYFMTENLYQDRDLPPEEKRRVVSSFVTLFLEGAARPAWKKGRKRTRKR